MLDNHAFLGLDEDILGMIKIAARTDPRVNDAVNLIRYRYMKRDLYKVAISQSINVSNPFEYQVWKIDADMLTLADPLATLTTRGIIIILISEDVNQSSIST